MRVVSITVDGEPVCTATIRDDVALDQLAITVLKAIRDVPAPRKTRSDAGQRKPRVLPPAATPQPNAA